MLRVHTLHRIDCKDEQTNTQQLYVHWWDFTVSVPELMQSLNHLVRSGKVLYLGISDSPAWVVRYVTMRASSQERIESTVLRQG